MRDALHSVPPNVRWLLTVTVSLVLATVAAKVLDLSFWMSALVGFPFGWFGSKLGKRWAQMEASDVA